MKESLKLTARLLFTFSVLLLSLLIFALSCYDDDNPGGYRSRCNVGECLEIKVSTGSENKIKIVDKTNIIINAGAMPKSFEPISRVGPYTGLEAGVEDLAARNLFYVTRKGSYSSMVLVNRSHVTKDTIALDAAKPNCNNTSEEADNLLAKREIGGTCRTYKDGTNLLSYQSYLGTVFNNTDTQKARITMGCRGFLSVSQNANEPPITDNTKFIRYGDAICYLRVINDYLNGLRYKEINDDWVDGPGGTATEEVEFYATSFDVSEKTMPQFLPASENFNLAKYNKAIDNATFKKLFDHNLGEDFKFKVKIVKSTDY